MKLKNHFIQTTVLIVILFIVFFKLDISYNEMDVIPYGRSLYNGKWLSNDWYLNLEIPYRFLFSYPVGYFSDNFGFIKTIYIGRIISYILIAISATKLINTIRGNQPFSYYLLALTIFFYYFGLGSGAGEWMVGGLDTKVFAYGFTLLSISYYIEENTKKWLFFSGLALSFHMLIGLFNLISFLPLVIISQKQNRNYIIKTIKLIPIFIASGLIGIYGIINQLITSAESISNIGWDIYVNIRVAHHALPNLFPRRIWLFLILFSVINISILINSKIIKLKKLSIYALATASISVIGLSIFLIFGNNNLLRYYFFRFSDVMLPLLTIISITYLIIKRTKSYSLKAKNILHFSTIIAFSIIITFSINQFYLDSKLNFNSDDLDMINWVKNNTNSSEGFIANPNLKMFYINYERSIFVSWKHSPQNNKDIIEWYNRLKLLNGGNDFTSQDEVASNYKNLTENQILSIKETYSNLRYILVPKSKSLDFTILHQTSKNTLYLITNPNK